MSEKYKKWTEVLAVPVLGAAIYLGSGTTETAVAADATTADATTDNTLQEVIVTGSHIARTDV
jgi:hypothetical protein